MVRKLGGCRIGGTCTLHRAVTGFAKFRRPVPRSRLGNGKICDSTRTDRKLSVYLYKHEIDKNTFNRLAIAVYSAAYRIARRHIMLVGVQHY